MFSRGYGQQKSCAEATDFCDMFRTPQEHWSASATRCAEASDLTVENLLCQYTVPLRHTAHRRGRCSHGRAPVRAPVPHAGRRDHRPRWNRSTRTNAVSDLRYVEGPMPVPSLALCSTRLRRLVPVRTLAISWPRWCGHGTARSAQRATRQRSNGRASATTSYAAHRCPSARAQQSAADSALSGVVGVGAGRQPKSGNQGQAQQQLTIHGSFSFGVRPMPVHEQHHYSHYTE